MIVHGALSAVCTLHSNDHGQDDHHGNHEEYHAMNIHHDGKTMTGNTRECQTGIMSHEKKAAVSTVLLQQTGLHIMWNEEM